MIPWFELSKAEQFAVLVRDRSGVPGGVEEVARDILLKQNSNEVGGPCLEKGVWPDAFLRANFESVMVGIPLRSWGAVLEAWKPEQIGIDQHRAVQLSTLSMLWRELEDQGVASLDAVDHLVAFLVEALGWERARTLRVDGETIPCVKTRSAILNLPTVTPLVSMHITNESVQECHSDLKSLQLLLKRDHSYSLIFFLAVGCQLAIAKLKHMLKDNRDVFVLEESRVRRIFSGKRYSKKLNDLLRAVFHLARLNPYSTEKPVSDPRMFVGREREAMRILSQQFRDFMIIGGRQIGKSSLLAYLAREADKYENKKCILVDAGTMKTEQELFYHLSLKINAKRASRITRSTFSQMLMNSSAAKGKRFIFLIDEIDGFLKRSKENADWTWLEVLRDLSQNQATQTVFSGYRMLYSEWLNLASPLYNFATPVYLSTLDGPSANKLIREPIAQLGVTFEGDGLVQHIQTQTGCHPSFVQFFCSALLEELDTRNSRVITWDIVKAVHSRREYADFLLRPYTHKDNLSNLERLILLHAAKGNRHEFDLQWVFKVVGDTGLRLSSSEVLVALQNIQIAGIVKTSNSPEDREGAENKDVSYELTLPSFPLYLRKYHPVEREIEEHVRAIKSTEQ